RYDGDTDASSPLPDTTSTKIMPRRSANVTTPMPRMNSITERWVQSCRRELLDRTLIWNQRHLLHALRDFEDFYNAHRPHQGIANARPLHPLPAPITDPEQITHLEIRRRQRLGGIFNEYQHAA
ncbi:integrase core domain-containing protein, partial [Streptomyces sp. NPDC057747]|uniref:integrase core domain-containing protein n=2 Tax=unclassified Streptomyces TaxID=2593676 RepID=UPI0036A1785B